jgi:hypothetical protein
MKDKKNIKYNILKVSEWPSPKGSKENTYVLTYGGRVFIMSTLDFDMEEYEVSDKEMKFKCPVIILKKTYIKNGLEKEGLHLKREKKQTKKKEEKKGPKVSIPKNGLSHKILMERYDFPIFFSELEKDGYTYSFGNGKYSPFLIIEKNEKELGVKIVLERYQLFPAAKWVEKAQSKDIKELVKRVRKNINNTILYPLIVNGNRTLKFDEVKLGAKTLKNDDIKFPLSIEQIQRDENLNYGCLDTPKGIILKLQIGDWDFPNAFWMSRALKDYGKLNNATLLMTDLQENSSSYMLGKFTKKRKTYYRIYKRKFKSILKK